MWIGALTGVVAAVAVAAGTGALSGVSSLFKGDGEPPAPGWSPPRATYSCRKPAPCVGFGSAVVLNALTNNPSYGDERNFLVVKPVTVTTPGGWHDVLAVEPGDEVLIRQYVSNGSFSTVAENARVSLQIPPERGRHLLITGRNSADNAVPRSVSDQVRLDAGEPITAEYVAHSASVFGNAFPLPQGERLSDFYAGDGALLGYNKLDGRLRPAFGGNLIVTARVRIIRG